MGGRSLWVVLIVASGCGADDEARPSFGSATITVSDGGGSDVDTKPFVAKTVSVGIGKQCSGGVPGVSKGSCFSYLTAKVEADGQSVTLRLWSDAVEGDEQARRVRGSFPTVVSEVMLVQGPTSESRFWSESNSTKFERATVSVAADGRVTYELASLLEPSRFSKGVGSARIEASIVIDCAPDGPDTAICRGGSGPPRP